LSDPGTFNDLVTITYNTLNSYFGTNGVTATNPANTDTDLVVERSVSYDDPLSQVSPGTPRKMILIDFPQNQENEQFAGGQINRYIDTIRLTCWVQISSQDSDATSNNYNEAASLLGSLRTSVIAAMDTFPTTAGLVRLRLLRVLRPTTMSNYAQGTIEYLAEHFENA
jgi:hypothetical protein